MVPLFCRRDTSITRAERSRPRRDEFAYQVSSEGLRQDHLRLEFLLNVLRGVNHPLTEGKRGVEDWKNRRNRREVEGFFFAVLVEMVLQWQQAADLMTQPGPVLLLDRQALRITRQIR